jgi:hypothetical protein
MVFFALRGIDDECIGVFTAKLEPVMADCQLGGRCDPACDSLTRRVKHAFEPAAGQMSSVERLLDPCFPQTHIVMEGLGKALTGRWSDRAD